MFPKHALQPTSVVSFLIAAFIGGLCSTDSFSQEPSSRGARTRSDEQGRIVGLTYWGRGGLRQSAPKDVSNLTNVEISYGTTLTRDDIEFLASLQNVEALSFGGNLSIEDVVFEGDLSPLCKLKRLESLFLYKRDMRDSDLTFLPELPNLRTLEFLAGPTPLTENGSSVTDACAESIGQVKSLRWLGIYNGHNLSDRFIEGISQNLKELEHLYLSSDKLTDRTLQLLAKQCGNLKSIDLYSKTVHGPRRSIFSIRKTATRNLDGMPAADAGICERSNGTQRSSSPRDHCPNDHQRSRRKSGKTT